MDLQSYIKQVLDNSKKIVKPVQDALSQFGQDQYNRFENAQDPQSKALQFIVNNTIYDPATNQWSPGVQDKMQQIQREDDAVNYERDPAKRRQLMYALNNKRAMDMVMAASTGDVEGISSLEQPAVNAGKRIIGELKTTDPLGQSLQDALKAPNPLKMEESKKVLDVVGKNTDLAYQRDGVIEQAKALLDKLDRNDVANRGDLMSFIQKADKGKDTMAELRSAQEIIAQHNASAPVNKTVQSALEAVKPQVDPLLSEDRKLIKIYRGQKTDTLDFSAGRRKLSEDYRGVAFSRDPEVAKDYGPKTIERFVDESQLLQPNDIPPATLKKLRADWKKMAGNNDNEFWQQEEMVNEALKIAESKGKHGADISKIFPMVGPEAEIRMINPDVLKTTDLYNKSKGVQK
jgi:hypothetical protein